MRASSGSTPGRIGWWLLRSLTIPLIIAAAALSSVIGQNAPAWGAQQAPAAVVQHVVAQPAIGPHPPKHLDVTSIQSVERLKGGGWKQDWFRQSGNNPGNASFGESYIAYATGYANLIFGVSVTPSSGKQDYIVINPNRGNGGKLTMKLITGNWKNNVVGHLTVGAKVEFLIGSSPLIDLTSDSDGMPRFYGGVDYDAKCGTSQKLVLYASPGEDEWRQGAAYFFVAPKAGFESSGQGVWLRSAGWNGPASNDTLKATVYFNDAWQTTNSLVANTNAFSAVATGGAAC